MKKLLILALLLLATTATAEWRKFAVIDGDSVTEIFVMDDAHPDYAERTQGAIDITGADIRPGDVRDGGTFQEREPEVYMLLRAIVLVLKQNYQNGVITAPQEALDLFQKVKAQ